MNNVIPFKKHEDAEVEAYFANLARQDDAIEPFLDEFISSMEKSEDYQRDAWQWRWYADEVLENAEEQLSEDDFEEMYRRVRCMGWV